MKKGPNRGLSLLRYLPVSKKLQSFRFAATR